MFSKVQEFGGEKVLLFGRHNGSLSIIRNGANVQLPPGLSVKGCVFSLLVVDQMAKLVQTNGADGSVIGGMTSIPEGLHIFISEGANGYRVVSIPSSSAKPPKKVK